MNEFEAVRLLRQAQLDRKAISPLTQKMSELSLEKAYDIQAGGLELAQASGAKVCGYKMGLTSRAKQQDVKVFEPIRGYLLDEMEVSKGDDVRRERYIHPRVEPELAIVFGEPVTGERAQIRDLLPAIRWIGPALEILDSRFEAYAFSLGDVVADNTSAAGFLLGTTNYKDRLQDIRLMGVAIRKNGVIEQTGAPAAVLGDPLISAMWAVRGLARRGQVIEPGQVLLTGGITAAVPFDRGDHLEILWPGETLSFDCV
jgi:2-oxo-3-hexenedioate decarboxylase